MEIINLSELLGAKNTKYGRNKLLEEMKRECTTAEICYYDNSYFIVVADEVMSMDDLLISELVSEAQRNVIRQSITGNGEFKTVYRNNIIETFEQYYQFVKFSIGKGASRKLLLGNSKIEPDLKIDKRELGNNSLSYASQGAVLLNQLICSIRDGTCKVPPSNICTDKNGKKTVYFTRFEWYERAFMSTNALSEKKISPTVDDFHFSQEKWKGVVNEYRNQKKGFYKTRLNSFVKRLSKSSSLEFEERLVGKIFDLEKNIKGGLSILDESTQKEVQNHEKTLLEKYSLTYFEVYFTKKSGVEEWECDYKTYIKEKFKLTKIWRVLAIEIRNDIGNAELIDNGNLDLEDTKKSLCEAVEEDWKRWFDNHIEKKKAAFIQYENLPTTNIHLPWRYYDTIFEGYVYRHLDGCFGFGLFNRADKIRYLEEHFSPVNENYTLGEDVSELIEWGVMTEEDVQNQLDAEHENYVLGIDGYRMLFELRERFCRTRSKHEDELKYRRTNSYAFLIA